VSDGGGGALHWLINEVGNQVGDPEHWPAFVPCRAGTIDLWRARREYADEPIRFCAPSPMQRALRESRGKND